MEDDTDGEKQNRVLLRPWLENMLENRNIPGLEWFDKDKTMFKVPWKHRSKKDWSMRHSSVFLEWAKNTGRWSEGDPAPNFAQLKTRLRCAFNKAPDIDEMKEYHFNKGEEPYKVYRFNSRKGDMKSVFGRKTCQKTAGKQGPGSRSRSPQALKYESCEEEVIDEDDDAIYEEMESHPVSALTHLGNMAGVRKFEEMSEIGYKRSLSGEQLLNSAAAMNWNYESIQSQDCKSSVIPLSVELMTSSSLNDDSDCESEVLKKSSWNTAPQTDSDNTLRFVKHESSAGRVQEVKGRCVSAPISGGTADKMHLLQVASLFVEAAEIQKQENTEVKSNPQQCLAETAGSVGPTNHYLVIMPTSCKSEGDILNEISEGNVTSGYVTPTGAEACDVKIPLEEAIVSMASTECVSVFDIPRVQASKNADGNKMSSKSAKMAEAVLTQKPVSASHPVDLTVSSVPAQNKLEEGRVTSRQSYVGVKLDNQDAEPTKTSDSFRRNANETPVVSDTVCDMLKSLPEQATMEQVKHYFTQLSEFSNRLVEWENRLKSWEVQLQAKAETLYWRDRCFQSEMATKPSPNHVYLSEKACSPGAQVLNSSSTSSSINALASAVRSQSSSTTDVASGSSLSSSNSSSVVIQNGTPGGMVSSELRQRLTQMRVQSGSRVPVSHINTSTTTSGNQSGAAPSSLASLSKNRQPIIIEKVSGVQASSVDQHFLSRQQVACDAALTCGSQQAVPIVSLLGSGKALPMIFPVLGGSQPIVFLSPQMLSVPMTSAPVTLLQTPAGKSEVNVVSEPRQKTLPRLTFSVDSIDSVQNKPERSNLLNQKSDVEANVCAGVNSSRIVAKDIILASGAPLQSDIVAPPAVTLAVLQNPKEFQPCVVNGKTNDSDLENREISNDKSRSSDELAVASNQPISNDVVLSDGVQPSHSENSEQLQSNHENLVIHVNLNGRDVLTPVTGESDQIASGEKSSTVAVSLSEAIKGGNLAVAEHAMAVKTEKMAPHPGHQSLMDFTKWLHERMQNVYKEKESHGNILGDGSDSQIVLYTRTNAAPDLSDAKLLERKAAPCEILAEKVVRTGNESLVSSSDFEMDSDVSASPQVTPQVPLVVENENDFLRDDIADEEEPSPKEKLGLGRRKKRMGEKTHALKKVRMDV